MVHNTLNTKTILVLNAGSSSEKISLYQLNETLAATSYPNKNGPPVPQWKKEVDFPSGSLDTIDWQSFLAQSLAKINTDLSTSSQSLVKIDAVGHRVVHGGSKYNSAVVIDEAVKEDIKKYIPLAPLHNKVSFAQINAIEKILPNTKQIAVFDTAFHRTLPEAVLTYPVPYSWYKEYGIQRFGFHGINHQYCAERAAIEIGKELNTLSLIICHLGSGSSLAAVEGGKSVNTTMGFTPLEGLMMASRCGSIDAGILMYLLENKKLTLDKLDVELNKNSGLKGIANTSDMKEIISRMQDKAQNGKMAKLAFDMFIERLRASMCAMRASLPKLDALVFTGGIGENSSLVREKTLHGLDFLGAQKILVIKAQEDWSIAQQSFAIS